MAGLPERLRASVVRQLDAGEYEVEQARGRIRDRLGNLLELAENETEQLLARVISLSPQRILDRGYAVLWNADGELIRQRAQARAGAELRVRVADGEFAVTVEPASAEPASVDAP